MTGILRSDIYRFRKAKMLMLLIIVLMIIRAMSIYIMEPLTYISGADSDISYARVCGLLKQNPDIYSLDEQREYLQTLDWYKTDLSMYADSIEIWYFMIYIVGFAVTSDISNRTLKNTISAGASRKTYFMAKVCFTLIASVIFLFADSVFTYLANLIYTAPGNSAGFIMMLAAAIRSIPVIFFFTGLLFLIAFAFKKSSWFYVVSIPFMILYPIILDALSTLIRGLPRFFYSYGPAYMRSAVVLSSDPGYICTAYYLCIVYTVITLLISYRLFARQEVMQ